MKCVGIIVEYNPLHNGHIYHIEQSKKITGADCVIAVMSGDFVQRGAPAVYDKYTRTRMALMAGADVVIELPVQFATGSAEDFSACAVALLDKLGTVDAVCFGSESGNVSDIQKVAEILISEPDEYTDSLKGFLKSGITFPKARYHALLPYIINADALETPNNILGIEYCKAIIKRQSLLIPYTIKRQGNEYHDDLLSDHHASASAIRKSLKTESISVNEIKEYVPQFVSELIEQGYPVYSDDLSGYMNRTLLSLCHNKQELSCYADVSSEIAARIKDTVLNYVSFSQKTSDIKTKQYTYTRISRALLHIMLGITKEDMEIYRQNDYADYARILGFRKASSAVLTAIKANSQIPLITKTADADKILSAAGCRMLEQEMYCSHIYNSILYDKYKINIPNEYTSRLVIL